VEPRRNEEEKLRSEVLAAEEAVFGSLTRRAKDEVAVSETNGAGVGSGTGAIAASAGNGVQASKAGEGEATEVLLYGFGPDLQYSALDFYERVSGGYILEDYTRQSTSSPFNTQTLRQNRGSMSLSRAALRKKNTFAGGEHWIKVTFSTRSAAELACARSPHIVRGYLVYAEPWAGRGPGRDAAISATQAGARIDDEVMSGTFSTKDVQDSPSGSSATATSATATAANGNNGDNGEMRQLRFEAEPRTPHTTQRSTQSQPADLAPTTPSNNDNSTLRQRPRPRLDFATPLKLQDVSLAQTPAQAKSPWLRWLSGASEAGGGGAGAGLAVASRPSSAVTGSGQVAGPQNGAAEGQIAGLHWMIFAWLDAVLGTDLLGVKGE